MSCLAAADWDQQGTAAEDAPHKQLGSASSNIPQQRQAAARSDVQAEAEPAGSHAVLSPEGTSAEQAGASTQGPQSPGNKGDPVAGRLAAFGSSGSSPLHNPRSPRSPRQTSPQRPVTIPEDAPVAYAAIQRGSPTANLEPTPSPEAEFAGALKRLTAARRDGSFADWIRPSASSEQQQQRQDAIRSMTPRERRQLREQVKMKGKLFWHASYLQHWLIQNGRPEGAKLQLHGLLLSLSEDCLLISQKRDRSAGFCSTFRGEQRSA